MIARMNATRLCAMMAFAVLAVFFIVPLIFMIVVSFYKPNPMAFYDVAFVWDNYAKFFSSFYLKVSLRSLWSSGLGAILVVALAFPTVLAVSDLTRKWQLFWIILLLALMCMSEVIIGFAWLILLSESAGVPRFLEWIGIWPNARSLSPSFGAMLIGLSSILKQRGGIVALKKRPLPLARRPRWSCGK